MDEPVELVVVPFGCTHDASVSTRFGPLCFSGDRSQFVRTRVLLELGVSRRPETTEVLETPRSGQGGSRH